MPTSFRRTHAVVVAALFLLTPGFVSPCRAQVDYLLITDATLAPAFQALCDYRSTGAAVPLRTALLTVESIASIYSGTDVAERIKNCIKDYHDNHGTTYVAFGGDDTVVPMRLTEKEGEPYFPVELYFADTDGGSWDADGDGLYGEDGEISLANLTPEVCLGRIPVRTADHVRAYVAKAKTYESASPEGFANSMLMLGKGHAIAGDDRPADWRYHDPITDRETYMMNEWYLQEIQPYWQACPYDVFFNYCTSWDQESYGDYPLTRDNITERINRGYHFVIYNGHGGVRAWQFTGDGLIWHRSDVEKLTYTLPSIVWSGGCLSGCFDDVNVDDPSLAEAWIRHPTNGAVAVFGHVRSIGNNPNSIYTWHQLFRYRAPTVGEAFRAVQRSQVEDGIVIPEYRTWQLKFALLADPALRVMREEAAKQIQILVPRGLETIQHGSTLTIRWNACGTDFAPGDRVAIEVSSDSGQTWRPLTGPEGVPHNDRAFLWDTSPEPLGDAYRVRITCLADPSVSATSEKDFMIGQFNTLWVTSEPCDGAPIADHIGAITDYSITGLPGTQVVLSVTGDYKGMPFRRWELRNSAGLVVQSVVAPSLSLSMTENATATAVYGFLKRIELVPADLGAPVGEWGFPVLPTEDPALYGIQHGHARAINFDETPSGEPISADTLLMAEFLESGVTMNAVPLTTSTYHGPLSAPNAALRPSDDATPMVFNFTDPIVAFGYVNLSPGFEGIEFWSGPTGTGSLLGAYTCDRGAIRHRELQRFVGGQLTDGRTAKSVVLNRGEGPLEIDEVVFAVKAYSTIGLW